MAYVKAPIPSEVYHLTTKEHLPNILDDGQIRRFGDLECWFCETPEKLRAYMEQTVLCEGKPYYAVDGSVRRYPKFKPEDHVILKLTPCRREGIWYRWNQEIPKNSPPELVKAADEFSKLKIGYRGDLRFQDAQVLDVASFLQGQLTSQRVYTTRELWQRLDEKVECNWKNYQNSLFQMSPGLLIGKAEEIAATSKNQIANQRSVCDLERTSNEMDETCRLRQGEGYGVCEDDEVRRRGTDPAGTFLSAAI